PSKLEMTERGFPAALQIGRHLIRPEIEESWNAWYNEEYAPGFLKVPGALYVRRYRVIEGSCKFMTVYELENEEVPETKAWADQRPSSSPRTPAMRREMISIPGTPGVYQKRSHA